MNTHITAARQMVKQGLGGRIIGAGSIASYRTAGESDTLPIRLASNLVFVTLQENLGPYGATKFAVRGFTEVAAKEWAQYGIRVNGVSLPTYPLRLDANICFSIWTGDCRYTNVGSH